MKTPHYEITKEFSFCYGHRVHTQVLNAAYADDLKCACRHLHGHEATVLVTLSGSTLNEQGMVTDFRHLEWLKKFLNANLDHQFVFDSKDPLLPAIVPGFALSRLLPLILVNPDPEADPVLAGYHYDHSDVEPGPLKEYLEGLFIVNFVPTSENFSQWLAQLVQHYMKPLGVHVESLTWYETPKSSSKYVAG